MINHNLFCIKKLFSNLQQVITMTTYSIETRRENGARVARGARGSGRASITGRKRSQDKENQEESESTQGAPGDKE
jgi:hypothetical protein